MDGDLRVRRKVEKIFSDFRGRRAGFIKALTVDVDKLYQECDLKNVKLCLYALPNETWEVKLPVEVPLEFPAPPSGINVKRDGIQKEDWISLVATYSESWLYHVAFYMAGEVKLGKSERERLFQMIDGLPTLGEVVRGTDHVKSSKCSVSVFYPPHGEEEVEWVPPCRRCGGKLARDEAWARCFRCKDWSHIDCLGLKPEETEAIKRHKRRARCTCNRVTLDDCLDFLRLIIFAIGFLACLYGIYQLLMQKENV